MFVDDTAMKFSPMIGLNLSSTRCDEGEKFIRLLSFRFHFLSIRVIRAVVIRVTDIRYFGKISLVIAAVNVELPPFRNREQL